MKINLKLVLSFLVAFIIMLYFIFSHAYENKLFLSISGTKKIENIQIFYDTGSGFNEQSSDTCRILPNKNNECLFVLPQIDKLRIDFGDSLEQYVVQNPLFIHAGRKELITTSIMNGSVNELDIKNINNTLLINSKSNDSYVVLDRDFFTMPLENTTLKLFLSFLLIFVLTYVVISIFIYSKTLFSLVLFAIFLRFAYLYFGHVPLESSELYYMYFDEGTYYKYIQKILEHGLFSYFSLESSVEIAPGNILYHSFLFYVFNENILYIRLYDIITTTIIMLTMAFMISRILFKNTTLAFIPVGILSVYPELIYFSPSMLTELIFIAFLSIFVWSILKLHASLHKYSQFSWIILIAVVIVSASITRLVLLPFIFMLIVYASFLIVQKKEINYAQNILLSSFLSLVLIAPFFYNGHQHTGKYMISTGSGAVLWLGSRKDTNGDEPPYYHKKYDTNLITHGLPHISIEGDRLLKKAAIEQIKDDPINYLLLGVKKLNRVTIGNNYFWFFPYQNIKQYYDKTSFVKAVIKIFSIFLSVIITFFGLFYIFKYFFQFDAKKKILAVLTLFMILIYIPFLVNQRYGLPVFFLNSIWTVGYLTMYFRNHNRKELYTLIFLSMVTIVYVLLGL